MPEYTLKIEWDGGEDEDGAEYYGSILFPAPHLENNIVERKYHAQFATDLFKQMTTDINSYLADPVKAIKDFITPKSAPEIYILGLEYEVRQYEQSQKECEKGVVRAREAIEKRKIAIKKIKKEYHIKEEK